MQNSKIKSKQNKVQSCLYYINIYHH